MPGVLGHEVVTYVTEDDKPLVLPAADGGVLLSITVDCAPKFRTQEAFDRWLADVTRQWVNP